MDPKHRPRDRIIQMPNALQGLNQIPNQPQASRPSELSSLMAPYGSSQINLQHRHEDSGTNADRRVQQMIVDLITQDGVLNLQAKNFSQQQDETSEDESADGQRALNFDNIFCNQILRNPRFESIVKLNLATNQIQHIDGDFCKNLPNVEVLDLRANRISEISPHIKAMVSIRVLKLDKNELKRLPEELFDIKVLEELTFQQNKVAYLSPRIGKLVELKKLNMASNMIPKIPEEIGRCEELQTLCIQNNRFASFPCSFLKLTNLKELSLEWFIYAKPPKPQYISRKTREGTQIFESLMVLCNLLQKYKMNECALITFVENYSDDNFDKNQRDNRQRTPLHKAAVMGDTGVIEGLLMDKADTDLLDKDSCTPLCLAIRQENYEAAQSLIDGGADVNLGGGIFGSPVHLAIVRLKISIIQALIDKKADLNKQDSDGNTPLHLVMNIFSKNPERCSHILELLAMNGAKTNQRNNDHWASIHTAVRKGQEKGVEAIIKLNKRLIERRLEPFDLNIAGGSQMWSSLHLAAHASQLQIIADLTRAGADIFQRNQTNQLARHCAKGNYIMTKHIKLVEQLCLTQKFRICKPVEVSLILASTRESRMAQSYQQSSDGRYDQANLLRESKMQPIPLEENQRQKYAGVDWGHEPLTDPRLDHGYENFTHQLRDVRRELDQHQGHVSGWPPMLRRSSEANGLSELHHKGRAPLDNRRLGGVYGKLGYRHEEQGKDHDLDIEDTLRENMSDEARSLDEEYDVIEEDDAKVSRQMAGNSLSGPTPVGRRRLGGARGAGASGDGLLISHAEQRPGQTGLERRSSKYQRSRAGHPALQGRGPSGLLLEEDTYQHDQVNNLDIKKQQSEGNGDDDMNLAKLGMKRETQNRINMFHLKDILIKDRGHWNSACYSQYAASYGQSDALQEKLDALACIKKHSNMVVFQHAMRALIVSKDFLKIKESIIQQEILTTIASSIHFQLTGCLKKLLSEQEEGQQNSEALDDAIMDTMRDAIGQLQLAQKAYERDPAAYKPWKVTYGSANHARYQSSGPLGGQGQVGFQNGPNFAERNAVYNQIQEQNAIVSNPHGDLRSSTIGQDSRKRAEAGKHWPDLDGNQREGNKTIEKSNHSYGSYNSGAFQHAVAANSGVGAQLVGHHKGLKRFGGLVQPMHILNAQDVEMDSGSSGQLRGQQNVIGSQIPQAQSRHRRGEPNYLVENQPSHSSTFVDGVSHPDSKGDVTLSAVAHPDLLHHELSERQDFESQNTLSAKFENLPQNHAQTSLKGRTQGSTVDDVVAKASPSWVNPDQYSRSGSIQQAANPCNPAQLGQHGDARGFGQEDQFYNALRQLNRVNRNAPGEGFNLGQENAKASPLPKIHDQIPSSPQSINVFESKVARSIQQNQQQHNPVSLMDQHLQGQRRASREIRNIEEDSAEERFDEEDDRRAADKDLDPDACRRIQANPDPSSSSKRYARRPQLPECAQREEEKMSNDNIRSQNWQILAGAQQAAPRGPPDQAASAFQGGFSMADQGLPAHSMENLSTVKKKETSIIQRQLIINIQNGQNPISPQSSAQHGMDALLLSERAPEQKNFSEDQPLGRTNQASGATLGKTTKSTKTHTKRGSKPNHSNKDSSSQSNRPLRHSNSVSSLKSAKSLRSMNSLKNLPGASSTSNSNSMNKKANRKDSNTKQKIQSHKSKGAGTTTKQNAKSGSQQQDREQSKK